MGGGTPEMFADGLEKLKRAWSEAGREGEPRAMALAYFSLGDDAKANAEAYLTDYYEWLGEHAQGIADSAAKDADTVRDYIRGFERGRLRRADLHPELVRPRAGRLLAEAAHLLVGAAR